MLTHEARNDRQVDDGFDQDSFVQPCVEVTNQEDEEFQFIPECKTYDNDRQAFEDRYISKEFIATGGFGTVYKVTTKNYEKLALKLGKQTSEVMISVREYQKMRQITHCNIIKTCDLFMIGDGIVGIEMELMKMSLKNVMTTEKPFSEKIMQTILVQMCSALEILKVCNLIHRDIKPDNILIRDLDLEREEVSVVLSDFGLARNLDTFTSTGISGTVNFIAPEVIQASIEKKENPFSFASDIFALGVTIYQLMTLDFSTSLSSISLIQDNLSDFIKTKTRKEYSQQLIEIVASMCKHDPNSRITSGEIIRILTPYEVKITEFGRAKSFYTEKEYEKALLILNQIIESDPTKSIFLHQRYLTFKKLKNYEKAIEDLNRALELDPNNASYLNSLGVCYKEGGCVKKDWDKAISLFERSRNGQAFYNLGIIYKTRFSKQPKYKKKDPLIERRMNEAFLLGAEKDNKLCQQEYGLLCLNCNDYLKAVEWLKKSDTPLSNTYLGNLYMNGSTTVQKDPRKAFEYYSKSNTISYHAYCYEEGIGTQKDPQKAFKMYQENERLMDCKLGMGRMYFKGWEGTNPDYQKSFKYCTEVFEYCINTKDNQDLKNEAMYYLAEMYYYGKGIPEDELLHHTEKAASYYNLLVFVNKNVMFKIGEMIYKQSNPSFVKTIKSYGQIKDEVDMLEFCADEGFKQAKIYVGEMLFNGYKCREVDYHFNKDLERAFHYFSDESVKDDPVAQYYLALIYREGTKSTKQDTELSIKLLEESGEKGYALSYYELGRFYEKQNNITLAKKYYFLAADLGLKEAKKKLESCLIA